MKTAVEWLVEELTKQNMFMHLFAKEIEQALEIEKEQIEKLFQKHYDETGYISMTLEDAERYYNETYGK